MKPIGYCITLTIALLSAGCREDDPSPTFWGQKFATAPGSDQGAFVVTFSSQSDHTISVHLVGDGTVDQVWSGVASPTDQKTAPYVAITTYGVSPEDTTPKRLHILTSSGDQEILDLPAGVPWINLGSHGGKISGNTVIFDCATYPEGFDGSFPEHNGHWPELESYAEKSKNSGWRYIVVQSESAPK